MCVSPVWGSPAPSTAETLPRIPMLSVHQEDGQALRALGVRRVPVGADDLALLPDGAREPVGRVAEPGAELHHAACPDRPRGDLQEAARRPAYDGKPVLRGVLLHVRQHGIFMFDTGQLGKVTLDAVVHVLAHGPTLSPARVA